MERGRRFPHPLLVSKHLYGFLFATLGARTIGGDKWERWFVQARDYLLKKQSKGGEWREVYRAVPDIAGLKLKKEKLTSRSMSTSIALIVLQLPLDKLSFGRG